eukprot:NODE_31_length_32452_cov_0.352672.p5 type:complete len:574 gc:universal NODE_31_length_32452_cov_0.352672:19450-21171(+)
MEKEIDEKFENKPFETISKSKAWKCFEGINNPEYDLDCYLIPLELWKNEDERLLGILEYKYAFRSVIHSESILKKNFPTSFLKDLTLVTIKEIVNAITGLIVVDKVDSLNDTITLSDLVMEDGKTDIIEAVVGVEDNSLTCNCKHFATLRKLSQKRKRSKLSHFCKHCFFVSHVILKRDSEHILDFTVQDLSSFFIVHGHFDVYSQTKSDQSIIDLVWCPVCEQLLLKSKLESYKDNSYCVFHCSVYLKTFMYYNEKKQQMESKAYLSKFRLFNNQFIQDISNMDPLMINHWGLLHILVDIKDKSIIFNEEILKEWQLYLDQSPPGMGVNNCLDVFVFDRAYLNKIATELVDFYAKTESSEAFENTFIWKYSKTNNQPILKGRFTQILDTCDITDYEFVFHATNLESAVSISERVEPISTRNATDLGPGFYCGTDMNTCISYALSKDGRVKDKKYEKEYVYVAVVCFAVEKTVVELEINDDDQLKQFIWSNRMSNYDGMTSDDKNSLRSFRGKSIKSKTGFIEKSGSWKGIRLDVNKIQIKYDENHNDHLNKGLLGICIIKRNLRDYNREFKN